MDGSTIGFLSSGGVSLLVGIVWAVRQEGRINALDQLMDERRKLDDERHMDNKGRLTRIEAKLDSLPARLNGNSRADH